MDRKENMNNKMLSQKCMCYANGQTHNQYLNFLHSSSHQNELGSRVLNLHLS
jgi:hypothetical protein